MSDGALEIFDYGETPRVQLLQQLEGGGEVRQDQRLWAEIRPLRIWRHGSNCVQLLMSLEVLDSAFTTADRKECLCQVYHIYVSHSVKGVLDSICHSRLH